LQVDCPVPARPATHRGRPRRSGFPDQPKNEQDQHGAEDGADPADRAEAKRRAEQFFRLEASIGMR
jgi:hypothetical protein